MTEEASPKVFFILLHQPLCPKRALTKFPDQGLPHIKTPPHSIVPKTASPPTFTQLKYEKKSSTKTSSCRIKHGAFPHHISCTKCTCLQSATVPLSDMPILVLQPPNSSSEFYSQSNLHNIFTSAAQRNWTSSFQSSCSASEEKHQTPGKREAMQCNNFPITYIIQAQGTILSIPHWWIKIIAV